MSTELSENTDPREIADPDAHGRRNHSGEGDGLLILGRDPPMADLEVGPRCLIEEGARVEILQRIKDVRLACVDLTDAKAALMTQNLVRHDITFRGRL